MRRSLLMVVALMILCAGVGIVAHPSIARAEGCDGIVDGNGCLYGLPADVYNGLYGVMQANPAPPVESIGVSNDELSRWSFWKIAKEEVTLYDGPDGNPLETVKPGFAFVLAHNKTENWIEIEPGKWIAKTDLAVSRPSAYTGVILPGGLPLQMAWITRPVRPSLTPGAKADASLPVLRQYTRVYIYHAVMVGNWEWYLIGPGQWVQQLNVGRVNIIAPPGVGGRWVAIDLYEQVMVAYEGGTPVFATLVSSGLRSFSTREGLFKVWSKLPTDAMSGLMGQPQQYSIPRVPYVMYFDGDIALHGAFWHNSFGGQKSRGCVNLSVGDAKWLYNFIGEGTPVYVFRSR
ncbi:MAG: L,D-transpeptidase [Anaerolinea sp.]|nr:L,D-transpeptidase [Anaerolinea sp.]